MTARYDDPDDAEDVAGEAYRRWITGLKRPLWRDHSDAHRLHWHAKAAAERSRLPSVEQHSITLFCDRVRSERQARQKGDVA